MSVKRYLPTLLISVLVIGIGSLAWGFLSSNFQHQETVFSIMVTGPAISALLLSLLSSIVSLPSVENYFETSRSISGLSYWIIVILPVVTALILALISVLVGGSEYTAFQASVN